MRSIAHRLLVDVLQDASVVQVLTVVVSSLALSEIDASILRNLLRLPDLLRGVDLLLRCLELSTGSLLPASGTHGVSVIDPLSTIAELL